MKKELLKFVSVMLLAFLIIMTGKNRVWASGDAFDETLVGESGNVFSVAELTSMMEGNVYLSDKDVMIYMGDNGWLNLAGKDNNHYPYYPSEYTYDPISGMLTSDEDCCFKIENGKVAYIYIAADPDTLYYPKPQLEPSIVLSELNDEYKALYNGAWYILSKTQNGFTVYKNSRDNIVEEYDFNNFKITETHDYILLAQFNNFGVLKLFKNNDRITEITREYADVKWRVYADCYGSLDETLNLKELVSSYAFITEDEDIFFDGGNYLYYTGNGNNHLNTFNSYYWNYDAPNELLQYGTKEYIKIENGKPAAFYQENDPNKIYYAYPKITPQDLTSGLEELYVGEQTGTEYKLTHTQDSITVTSSLDAVFNYNLNEWEFCETDDIIYQFRFNDRFLIKYSKDNGKIVEVRKVTLSAGETEWTLYPVDPTEYNLRDLTKTMDGYVYMADNEDKLYMNDGAIIHMICENGHDFQIGFDITDSTYDPETGICTYEDTCFVIENGKVTKIYNKSRPEQIFLPYEKMSPAELTVRLDDAYVGTYYGRTYTLTKTNDSLTVTGGSQPEEYDLNEWEIFETEDYILMTNYYDNCTIKYAKTYGVITKIYKDTYRGVWWEVYPYTDPSLPSFKTTSLVLSGQIGVNFFMNLPEADGADYENSYMTFSVQHGKITERADFDPNFMNSTKTLYGFKCYINAIQMAEPITATFHYVKGGVEKTTDNTFAVKDYFTEFDKITSENPYAFSDEMKALIMSLADYGHYVQPFLAEANGWTLGTDYALMDKFYTESYDIDAIKTAASFHAARYNDQTEGDLKSLLMSLALDSSTTIVVTVKTSDEYRGTVTASIDGGEASPMSRVSKGKYRIKIIGIPSHELSKIHTITVTTTEGHTADASFSALSYIAPALNYYTDDAAVQNAMASIYMYSNAADELKSSQA